MSADWAASTLNTTVQALDGSSIKIPVSVSSPLFIVGPNGSGKSALILWLYRMNHGNAVRITAHRQNWMQSNSIPFAPNQKVTTHNQIKGQDNQPSARWQEWNPASRIGLTISDIIDAENHLSRRVRAHLVEGKTSEALVSANKKSPLDNINDMFSSAGIPITLSISEESSLFASKSGSLPYSIASLSDGERAALLIAGAVLTAPSQSLILIDEPERHLHPSIVTPLLQQIFSSRADCAFIISTHELNLPVSASNARTILVRDSQSISDDINRWDLDVLEPGVAIGDDTKEAILGARRTVVFIEGTETSLDKRLYQILFPHASLICRSTAHQVTQAVQSIRDSRDLAWVNAFGIVDQDQINQDHRQNIKEMGIFALSSYSVESIYYHPFVIREIAKRQSTIIEYEASVLFHDATANAIARVREQKSRLAARMSEQAVKNAIQSQIPDWRTIKNGEMISISVDSKSIYEEEEGKLDDWLQAQALDKIVGRYPIRETSAIDGIVAGLRFRDRSQYESAVLRCVREDAAMRTVLRGFFWWLRPTHNLITLGCGDED